MIGFANGASSKTKLGMLGFGSEANKPIFRDTSTPDYLIAHAGNITTPSDTSVTWNTEKTIATIAGVEVKIKFLLIQIVILGVIFTQVVLQGKNWYWYKGYELCGCLKLVS